VHSTLDKITLRTGPQKLRFQNVLVQLRTSTSSDDLESVLQLNRTGDSSVQHTFYHCVDPVPRISPIPTMKSYYIFKALVTNRSVPKFSGVSFRILCSSFDNQKTKQFITLLMVYMISCSPHWAWGPGPRALTTWQLMGGAWWGWIATRKPNDYIECLRMGRTRSIRWFDL
jgi:hypothetical protein